MTEKKTPDTFARNLETRVRTILKNEKATITEQLKAVDLGIKVCALRAKLKLKPGEKDDESFFG